MLEKCWRQLSTHFATDTHPARIKTVETAWWPHFRSVPCSVGRWRACSCFSARPAQRQSVGHAQHSTRAESRINAQWGKQHRDAHYNRPRTVYWALLCFIASKNSPQRDNFSTNLSREWPWKMGSVPAVSVLILAIAVPSLAGYIEVCAH